MNTIPQQHSDAIDMDDTCEESECNCNVPICECDGKCEVLQFIGAHDLPLVPKRWVPDLALNNNQVGPLPFLDPRPDFKLVHGVELTASSCRPALEDCCRIRMTAQTSQGIPVSALVMFSHDLDDNFAKVDIIMLVDEANPRSVTTSLSINPLWDLQFNGHYPMMQLPRTVETTERFERTEICSLPKSIAHLQKVFEARFSPEERTEVTKFLRTLYRFSFQYANTFLDGILDTHLDETGWTNSFAHECFQNPRYYRNLEHLLSWF